MITIRYFGQAAEASGQSHQEWSVENRLTVEDLTRQLEKRYPSLEKLNYRVARNTEMTNGATELEPGDEIALLPPFAGG